MIANRDQALAFARGWLNGSEKETDEEQE